MPETINELIKGNKSWVRNITKVDPEIFNRLSEGQSPNFLWIGCSDSRVPVNEVTNQLPGSIFVHRNIANMVLLTDFNLLSVVYYAVVELKVKHIIVCGHYDCGGVGAAMSNKGYGFLDNWLANIKGVYRMYQKELDAIEDEKKRLDRFVELNVLEQVHSLATISFIQDAWAEDEFPYIHGWVYQLESGLVKDLDVTINNSQQLEEFYKLKQEA